MEPVINSYYKKNNLRIKQVNLKGVKEVIKTRKKYHGLAPHIKETVNVTSVYAQLYIRDAQEKIAKLKNYKFANLLPWSRKNE
jgi:hypothetical protein